MKKVLFKIYLIFDFIILLVALLGPRFISYFITSDINLLSFILIGIYLSINSIVGIIWSKKNKDFVDFRISNNWFLPMYIVNALSAFLIYFPILEAFHCLSSKDYIASILYFLVSLIPLLSILGQVKWQKMILANPNSKRFTDYYICISNPIKCFLILIIIQVWTLPSV